MNCRQSISLLAACSLTGLLGSVAPAAGAAPPMLYEVTTQTGMPHLDENLRYAIRTEAQCLDPRDLSTAFWMLRDVSLQDCGLVKTRESADAANYVLICHGGHGTTGTATWQFGQDAIVGTLDVRLGGKNMTFYQRITARPIGSCDRSSGMTQAPAQRRSPSAQRASGHGHLIQRNARFADAS